MPKAVAGVGFQDGIEVIEASSSRAACHLERGDSGLDHTLSFEAICAFVLGEAAGQFADVADGLDPRDLITDL